MFRFYCLLVALLGFGIVSAQNDVLNEIQNMKAAGYDLHQVNLLHFESADVQNRSNNLQGLKKGTIMNLDPDAIQALLREQNDFISISVPKTQRSKTVLTLKRHEIFTNDFALFTSSDPSTPVDYQPGLHYIGVVEGDPSSIVAVSIFKDKIMAMIATDQGNFTIGKIEGDENKRHIFYNDRDLDIQFNFECGNIETGIGYTKEQLKPVLNSRDPDDCLRVYIEIDNDIVVAKGGATLAADYMTAIFNQCFVIYANEQLTLTISEILAWTTTSPYTGGSSGQMLSSFRQYTEFINGDLGHLISFDSIFGGTAPLNSSCPSDPDYFKCYSGIRHSYDIVPNFSWPVFVISHEMGHVLGSHHTHACVWNGNNTAIDNCGGTGCGSPGLPPNGGTIMSYCYPSNGSFINFNEGFGPQPGNVIRNFVNEAGNCLSPCGQATEYCDSRANNSSQEYINKVVLGSINNLSGNNGGYADFTSMSTDLIAGNTYTVTLVPKFNGGHHTEYWRVYIDYNNDFDLYEPNETVVQVSGGNTINATFTVPAGSPTTTTRMRVSMKYQGFAGFCTTFPFGEVEEYTVNIIASTGTCTDGIQNQGETGVDCGGPCPACVSCSDGIQNQGETGVDCGGPCPACATCSDGNQNQGETGVDCGGPCPACPSGDTTVLLGAYFETGWDSWIDGGSDANRVNSSNSYEGLYSIKLADNNGVQSSMTSPAFDLSNAVGLQIRFRFYPTSMESGEDFWVRYNDGSGNWVTIATLTSGAQFVNNYFFGVTITVPGFVPTSAGSLRIQCDANDKNDQVFIDAVVITALVGTELIEMGTFITEIARPSLSQDITNEITVYPNPTENVLDIIFDGEIQFLHVLSPNGKMVHSVESHKVERSIDISNLTPGLYFLQIKTNDGWRAVRFIKM